MKAEEFIKEKVYMDYPGGHPCRVITEENALKAIEIAREEKKAATQNGLQGWVCPKCGRVYSPYTSMCSYCGNSSYSDYNGDYSGCKAVSDLKISKSEPFDSSNGFQHKRGVIDSGFNSMP